MFQADRSRGRLPGAVLVPPADVRGGSTAAAGLSDAAADTLPAAGTDATELSAASPGAVVDGSSAPAGSAATNTANIKTHSRRIEVTLIHRPSAPYTLNQQGNQNRPPTPPIDGAGA